MIPRGDFDRYARALGINADLLQAAIAQAIDECSGLYGEELYRALSRTYAALVAKFGSFAAAAAVEFYAAMRSGAGPAQGYEPRQFDPGHGGLLASDVDEALRASAPAAALAARAVQRAMGYADATIQGNAMADPAHPRWALVPHAGACDWCRMIGSRGFVFKSSATAGAERHPSCRCIPVADFSGSPALDGYDPAALYDEYRAKHPEWGSRRTGPRGRRGGGKVVAAFVDGKWIGYTDVDSSGRGARDGRAVYEGPQAPEAFHRRVQEADSRPLQRRKAQARDHGRVRPRQEHRGEVDQVDKRDRLAARRGQPHARAEPDPGARAREPQAPDGGRRLKTSGADIRSKVRAIAANEGRYPISAQCRLLGVARSTYYSMRSRADRPDAPDPAAPAVVAAHAASKGRYGSRKIKASLERSGVTVSRRRVCRIMRENGLVSAYGRKRFKVHPGAVNEADVPNVVARGFGGRAPRTHICSDLTYVRGGASWNYVCLLVDLYNREIVGHAAGPRKDARLVKSAFATLSFPISDIEVFHTDRGSEFDNAEIDLMLEAFGIERSLSAKGCPYDNAVDESTNRILKAELVHRETFGTTRELRAKLSDYVHWYNNFRIHSTLGYMSPVEFREAGLSLPESSK